MKLFLGLFCYPAGNHKVVPTAAHFGTLFPASFQVARMSYWPEMYMSTIRIVLSKLFLEETTDIEQWPDTF